MSTPIDIKAEAIALYAMGHSCRQIEKQLKAKFPDAKVPNYCTINRWTRPGPYDSRATATVALMQWNKAALKAGQIIRSRPNEIKTQPLEKVALCYGRWMDIVIALERNARG